MIATVTVLKENDESAYGTLEKGQFKTPQSLIECNTLSHEDKQEFQQGTSKVD